MENVTMTTEVQAAVDKILALKAQLNAVKAEARAEKVAKHKALIMRKAQREAIKAEKVRMRHVREILVIMRQHNLTVEDLETPEIVGDTDSTVH